MNANYNGQEVEILSIEKMLTEDEERQRQRIDRLTSFFARVNSAFTSRKVKVKTEYSDMQAPAWSSSDEVVFNAKLLGDLTAKDLTKLRGLDLHECAHILFTPRQASEMGVFIDDNKHLFMAYNALEDMRIETLMVTSYPSVAKWLTATMLHFFTDDFNSFVNSYPLVRGRRYLPVELRQRSRNMYPYQDLIEPLGEVIDEYRLLLYPRDTERAKELVQKFHDLLPKQEGGSGSNPDPNGSGGTITLTEGTPTSGQGGYKVTIKDPFGHGSRPYEGQESSNSRPMNPKKQSKIQERAKSQTQHNDSKEKTESGNKAGNEFDEKIETLLNDLLQELSNDIHAEVSDMHRIIGGLPALQSNNSREPQLARYNLIYPDSATMHASQKFGKELEKLKAQYDPAWEQFESKGRLNVPRLIRGDDHETIFDMWNEGVENACEIECVVMLDVSGSMQGDKATSAYRAMYAIKRGLSKINANCSVITFSDSAEMLYRAKDKVTSGLRDSGTGGGTNATEAIAYSTKLLADSDKAVKIFFAITDGEWWSEDNNRHNHEAIKRMGNSGVLTAFAYIPETQEEVQKLTSDSIHHCEIGAVVRNPFDLLSMARVIVKYAINRRLVNR